MPTMKRTEWTREFLEATFPARFDAIINGIVDALAPIVQAAGEGDRPFRIVNAENCDCEEAPVHLSRHYVIRQDALPLAGEIVFSLGAVMAQKGPGFAMMGMIRHPVFTGGKFLTIHQSKVAAIDPRLEAENTDWECDPVEALAALDQWVLTAAKPGEVVREILIGMVQASKAYLSGKMGGAKSPKARGSNGSPVELYTKIPGPSEEV